MTFFMPWFFFKGGMFFRCRPLKDEIIISYKRLIIPYIVFSLIGTIILWTKMAVNGGLTWNKIIYSVAPFVTDGSLSGNLPLWFLLSLFVVRIMFQVLYALFRGGALQKGVCIIITTAICTTYIALYYVRAEPHRWYPFWLSNISSGMLFFALGYWTRKLQFGVWGTVVLIAAYISVNLLVPTCVDMRSGQLIRGFFLLWGPISLLSILTFNNTFRYFINKKNILTMAGRDSISYYCMHWCVIEIVSFFFHSNSQAPHPGYFITLILANLIILPVATHLIKRSRLAYIIN